ncbi:MAG: ABC-2, partial [uncultured Solirubrobacteraceae bacterium]
ERPRTRAPAGQDDAHRQRAPELARPRLAPVPARAPDVLAQPDRRVLQRRDPPAVPAALRDRLRGRCRPARGARPRHRRDERHDHHLQRARPQRGRAARARDPQADAQHSPALVRLPGGARRPRADQHRPAGPAGHRRRPRGLRPRLAARLGGAGDLRDRRGRLLRRPRGRARPPHPAGRVRAGLRQRDLPAGDRRVRRLLRRDVGARADRRHRPGAPAHPPGRRDRRGVGRRRRAGDALGRPARRAGVGTAGRRARGARIPLGVAPDL